jgi:hypothetical protein
LRIWLFEIGDFAWAEALEALNCLTVEWLKFVEFVLLRPEGGQARQRRINPTLKGAKFNTKNI